MKESYVLFFQHRKDKDTNLDIFFSIDKGFPFIEKPKKDLYLNRFLCSTFNITLLDIHSKFIVEDTTINEKGIIFVQLDSENISNLGLNSITLDTDTIDNKSYLNNLSKEIDINLFSELLDQYRILVNVKKTYRELLIKELLNEN